MQLFEIFDQLSHGEFRSTALGGSQASGILEKDYPRVIPLINLGLTELYKRFPIRSKILIIQQMEQFSIYYLHPDYAVTHPTSTKARYIKDTVFEPFDSADSVLKIEAVYDETGKEYYLNDPKQVHSLFTPSYNSIQVPFNDADNTLTVKYRTGHPKLQYDMEDVLHQEIELPIAYMEALLNYIAGRYLSSSGSAQAVQEGSLFIQKFELSCRKIEELGLYNQVISTNTKLDDNGWT